jgi:hypothetical protein
MDIKVKQVVSVPDPGQGENPINFTRARVVRIVDTRTVEVKYLEPVWNLAENSLVYRKGSTGYVSVARVRVG